MSAAALAQLGLSRQQQATRTRDQASALVRLSHLALRCKYRGADGNKYSLKSVFSMLGNFRLEPTVDKLGFSIGCPLLQVELWNVVVVLPKIHE